MSTMYSVVIVVEFESSEYGQNGSKGRVILFSFNCNDETSEYKLNDTVYSKSNLSKLHCNCISQI